MNLLKKQSLKSQKKRYNTLHDLPVFNWFKCRSNESFSFLLKDKSFYDLDNEALFKKFPGVDFEGLFLELLTEFFKEFGQTKEHKNELKLKMELHGLNIQYLKTGDRFIINHIETVNLKLNELQADNIDEENNIDIKKEIALIGKSMGAFIDTKKVTTYQYYTQRLLLLENG
jgi:hypothetical protein